MEKFKDQTRNASWLLLSATALLLSGCISNDETANRLTPYATEDRYPLTTQSVQAIKATDPAHLCGKWGTDLTDTSNNAMAPNHGCSVHANIAKMIANPDDVSNPGELTAASGETAAAAITRQMTDAGK